MLQQICDVENTTPETISQVVICYNRPMAKLSKSRTTSTKLIVAAVVIFTATSIYAWWQYSYTNPTKVFNRMVANNLATPSVTKSSVEVAGDQSLTQKAIIVTTPKQYVASQSTLIQGEGEQKTEVVTETLAYTNEEFTRYLSITTSQKSISGKPFDFSGVLGLWGVTTQEDADDGGNSPQTFSQAVLGIVPVGGLNAANRKELASYIKSNDVFGIDYSSVKKEWKNNRLVYTYQGSVKPVPYVTMLKTFSHSIGLTQLDSIDPQQYKNSASINFSLDVDVISGQMTNINYSDSERTDEFSAYGYRPVIKTPTNVVPIYELQSRLQQIQ